MGLTRGDKDSRSRGDLPSDWRPWTRCVGSTLEKLCLYMSLGSRRSQNQGDELGAERIPDNISLGSKPRRCRAGGEIRSREVFFTMLIFFFLTGVSQLPENVLLVSDVPGRVRPGTPVIQPHGLQPASALFPHVLYVCISIPALQIGSSIPFFQIPHICINIFQETS